MHTSLSVEVYFGPKKVAIDTFDRHWLFKIYLCIYSFKFVCILFLNVLCVKQNPTQLPVLPKARTSCGTMCMYAQVFGFTLYCEIDAYKSQNIINVPLPIMIRFWVIHTCNLKTIFTSIHTHFKHTGLSPALYHILSLLVICSWTVHTDWARISSQHQCYKALTILNCSNFYTFLYISRHCFFYSLPPYQEDFARRHFQ